MKYVAFLRGINVGGNNIIKMADLKAAFEKMGLKNVKTFIQSGNVVFETGREDKELIIDIEKKLSVIFNYKSKIVLISEDQLEKVLANVPDVWKKPGDLRCYIAFVREPTTVEEVLKEVELKEGIDSVKAGPGVLYMSTKLSGLTKSGFTKLIGKKIYQEITMRNYNTIQKIFSIFF